MKAAAHYWIAVVRPHNLDALILESGLTAYASTEQGAKRLQIGDHVALYRSGAGSGKATGFVATFDVTAPPEAGRARSLLPLYPFRIPCKATSIALLNPVSIVSLVPVLSFVKNKRRYGAHLQRAWIEIAAEDFERIRCTLEKQFAESGSPDITSEIDKYRKTRES